MPPHTRLPVPLMALARGQAEILLSMVAKTASSEAAPIWQRALALEACRVVASDPAGLRLLFSR